MSKSIVQTYHWPEKWEEINMENDNFGFRIDIVKWREALRALEERRKNWPVEYATKQKAALDAGQKYFYEYEPHWEEQLTRLYSIRAHSRGRIHRTAAKLTQYEWNKLGHNTPGQQKFTEANGSIKFDLTIIDQAKYLGDSWKEYEKVIVPE
jgi:hypothetical protein